MRTALRKSRSLTDIREFFDHGSHRGRAEDVPSRHFQVNAHKHRVSPSHTKPAEAGHAFQQAVRRLDAASFSVLPLELLGALTATTDEKRQEIQEPSRKVQGVLVRPSRWH